MNERSKLMLVFTIGLLLGFGGGRFFSGSQAGLARAGAGAEDATVLAADDMPAVSVNADNPVGLTVMVEPIVPAAPAAAVKAVRAEPAKPTSAVNVSAGVALDVLDQMAGSLVIVRSATFVRPGWVAIHEDRDGKPGNVLGAALFDRGTAVGLVELLRRTVAGGLYYAVLHDDDGDHLFEMKEDAILRTTAGEPVLDTFRAL